MNHTPQNLFLAGSNIAEAVSQAILTHNHLTAIPASIGHFGSGEPFVELFRDPAKFPPDKPFQPTDEEYAANLRVMKDAKVCMYQSTGEPVSRSCMHTLMMAHSLKEYGSKEVTAVIPFAAFARQDRRFKNRFTSMAADFFPQMLKAAGVDKVITITPHSQAAIDFYKTHFGNNFVELSTTDLYAEDIKSRFGGDVSNVVVGAPDSRA